GELKPAIREYDRWLETHEKQARSADAFVGRCRARAILGEELDKALDDCNRAVKARSDEPYFRDSRGLVHLRLGNFDKSIADYNAALSSDSANAWALYGRGLAKLRKGKTAEGQADIDAAKALEPDIVEDATTLGLAP